MMSVVVDAGLAKGNSLGLSEESRGSWAAGVEDLLWLRLVSNAKRWTPLVGWKRKFVIRANFRAASVCGCGVEPPEAGAFVGHMWLTHPRTRSDTIGPIAVVRATAQTNPRPAQY